jgi:hypothetical protein
LTFFCFDNIYKRLIQKVNNSIQLKNIDLSGISIDEEVAKLHEELKEFMSVIDNKDLDSSFNHAAEELFDILQVGLGLIQLKYKKDAEDVMRLYQYHLIKLGNRPREKKELTYGELLTIFIKQNEALKDKILDYRPAGNYALQIWFKDEKEVIVKYNGAKFEVVREG